MNADALSAQLSKHKVAILSSLRVPNARPINEDEAWKAILSVARLYARDPPPHKAMSVEERAKSRLIAQALGKARTEIDEALELPNLANMLVGSWEERTESDERLPYPFRQTDFWLMMDGLSALEAMAIQVAKDANRKRGRPEGTAILPSEIILRLAGVYQGCTGLEPGAGSGPFARFVSTFLAAMGRGVIGEASLVDAIKQTRREFKLGFRPWNKPLFWGD